MKLFHVTNIQWDIDGAYEADDFDVDPLNLPESLHVYADDEDSVADTMSDALGWCVLSLEIEEITEAIVMEVPIAYTTGR